MSAKPKPIHYPDDDGLPMSDNTWQFNAIVLLHSGLDALFQNAADVFVAGHHLIYPVKGQPDVRQAPDVYVAFGVTKVPRGSYRVWEEGNVFPQVVFEVWSPNNRLQAMEDKRAFYERYGAEEYYIVYPEFPSHVEGWHREGEKLVRLAEVNGHVSPRLGIRFDVAMGNLTVTGPDGRPFRSPADVIAERDEAERAAARLAAKLRELGVDPDGV
ncbi:MAG TPA: Uma2 family endonuclease [Gemmataceae bacterium]|nr:Uma2 family endonuclease [Gemmataceae bacterium]